MNKVRLLLNNITKISLLKSLYINFKTLKFSDAIKIPILLARKTKLKSLSGQLLIKDNITPGMIRIGFSKIFGIGNPTIIDLRTGSTLVFKGKCFIGAGSWLEVSNNSELKLGKGVSIGSNNKIVCWKGISIGDDTVTSWECTFIDSDQHKILINDKQVNPDAVIRIANNCWIGCNTIFLKGASIGTQSIVAAASIVTKKHPDSVIIAGSPAKITSKEQFDIVR